MTQDDSCVALCWWVQIKLTHLSCHYRNLVGCWCRKTPLRVSKWKKDKRQTNNMFRTAVHFFVFYVPKCICMFSSCALVTSFSSSTFNLKALALQPHCFHLCATLVAGLFSMEATVELSFKKGDVLKVCRPFSFDLHFIWFIDFLFCWCV